MFGITTYNSKSINNNHPTIWHGKKSNSRLGRLNFKGFECYWYIYILIYNPFKPSFKAFAPENLQVGKWQTHFQVGWFFWWICVVFCSDFGMFFFVAPIVTSLYEYIWSPSVEIDFGIACPIHLTDKPFASWNSCTAFLDFFLLSQELLIILHLEMLTRFQILHLEMGRKNFPWISIRNEFPEVNV